MSETISSVTTTTEGTERVLGLSDALFAIAITFLALDLGELPEDLGQPGGTSVFDFLHEHVPDYLVYFSVFLVVGFLWSRHHLIFRYITSRNIWVTWLNIGLLALVALLPYPAGLVSDAFGNGLAMCLLLGPLCLVAFLLWAIFEAAHRKACTIPKLAKPTVAYLRSRLIATSLILAIGVALALLSWKFENTELCYAAALIPLVLLIVSPYLFVRPWPVPEKASEYTPDEDAAEAGFDPRMPAAGQDTSIARAARATLTNIRNGSDAVRLKIFTDGVFAIAVTVLALQLRAPGRGSEVVTTEVILRNLSEVPVWTYITTFFLLSVFWIGHVHIFERVVGADSVLIWLNLLFLMFIAFMPLPAELIGVAAKNGVAGQVVYYGTLTMASICMVSITAYATFSKGIAIPRRGDMSIERLQIARAVWLCAAFLISTVLIAVTKNGAFAYLVLIAIGLRGVALRRFFPKAKGIHWD